MSDSESKSGTETGVQSVVHTPGPWEYSPQSGTVGHCFCAQVWGSDGRNLATLEATVDEAEATANAKLIAESPVMLEVVRIIAGATGDTDLEHAQNLSQEVIARLGVV